MGRFCRLFDTIQIRLCGRFIFFVFTLSILQYARLSSLKVALNYWFKILISQSYKNRMVVFSRKVREIPINCLPKNFWSELVESCERPDGVFDLVLKIDCMLCAMFGPLNLLNLAIFWKSKHKKSYGIFAVLISGFCKFNIYGSIDIYRVFMRFHVLFPN